MTTEEKIETLSEIFDAENLTPETTLDAVQWDSITMMNVMVHILGAGKKISPAELREMKTIGDILAVL